MSFPPSNTFLTSALGTILGPAVWQHQRNTAISGDMIATLALGCAAGVAQDLVDVQRPDLPPSSASLFTTVIAGSGEGKDTAVDPFLRPFLKFQADADTQAEDLRPARAAETLEWDLKRKLLVAQLFAAISAGESTGEIKDQVASHQRMRPATLEAPKILFKDVTPKALKLGLCDWRSAVLSSMEAGEFFNGRMAEDFPLVNDAWQGSPLTVDRVRQPRYSVPDPRLGLVLGVQPQPFMRFLRRRGVEANDSGFTARFLVALPESTRGERLIGGVSGGTNLIDAYAARAADLLQESAAATRARKPRRVLRFAPDAAVEFKSLYNRIQILMRRGNLLFDIPGFASKAAENVARVAAVLHVIDALDGDISIDTLGRATYVVEWFTAHFKYVFSQAGVLPSVEHDAEFLLRSISNVCLAQGALRRSHLQYCSGDLSPTRVKRALNLLVAQGKVVVKAEGRSDILSVPSFAALQMQG